MSEQVLRVVVPVGSDFDRGAKFMRKVRFYRNLSTRTKGIEVFVDVENKSEVLEEHIVTEFGSWSEELKYVLGKTAEKYGAVDDLEVGFIAGRGLEMLHQVQDQFTEDY